MNSLFGFLDDPFLFFTTFLAAVAVSFGVGAAAAATVDAVAWAVGRAGEVFMMTLLSEH